MSLGTPGSVTCGEGHWFHGACLDAYVSGVAIELANRERNHCRLMCPWPHCRQPLPDGVLDLVSGASRRAYVRGVRGHLAQVIWNLQIMGSHIQ